LSDQDAAEAEERALQLANEQAATAFDIGRAPLARVTLLRIGAQLHLLVVVVHHLIADGWSLGVFIEEMQEVYAARVAGRPHRLADRAIQFSDYAAWLAEQQARPNGRGEGLIATMASELAGAPALVTFPPDSLRPRTFDIGGGLYRFSLDDDLT